MTKKHRQRNRSLPTQELAPPGARIVAASYSGPLPPPAALERYEQVCPGAADRILKQWETQSQHRQALESAVVQSNVANSRRGQILGFLLAIGSLGIAAWLISSGQPVKGVIALLVEVGALAAVFIVARRRGQSELAEKRR